MALELSPLQLAKQAHLQYVTDHKPGITRKRAGDSFIYLDQAGQKISDPEILARIKSLVIPPAWEKVWICPQPNGHIQATGLDARGRKQYRYHARWREVGQETKFHKLVTFGEALPPIRETIAGHLRDQKLSKQKVMAAIVSLLSQTLIRIGNEQYAKENHSFGLTTLRDRHAKIAAKEAIFDFRGKSGVDHVITITDPKLVKIIKACQDLPGYELFQYLDESGNHQVLHSGDINEYLFQMTNQPITAKDFRTWGGTVLATETLRDCEECDSVTGLQKNVVQTVKVVAQHLGNRPATCKKYYIHPVVLQSYLDQAFLSEIESSLKSYSLPESLFALQPIEHATWLFVKNHT